MLRPPQSASRSQMALFYIFACIVTGRRSQTQRPLTHQSKMLLYSAAPHHTKVLSLHLSPPLLLSFVLFPLFLHFLSSSSFTKHTPLCFLFVSVQTLSDMPSSSLRSPSFFLLSVPLPRLHLQPHPLYLLQLRALSSTQGCRLQSHSLVSKAKLNRAQHVVRLVF